jgi:ribonuclease P protein subunit POP4
MPLTRQNVLRHELIGLQAKIQSSSDPALPGISGRIVDETRNMLVIDDGRRVRKIPKSSSTFLITMPDGETVGVEGTKLVGRPEERVRRRW